MQIFVTYLYRNQSFDRTEPEAVRVDSMDLNVHVPENAVGFSFAKAENAKEALKNPLERMRYLIGNAGQVLTLQDIKEVAENKNNEHSESEAKAKLNMLKTLEQSNNFRKARQLPEIVANFK